ncbi:MAG: alkaline phosphatase D family protein, partial [Rubrobacter sp.]
PVGRTKTAPREDATLRRLAFAFASCQMYEHGYYHAYRDMSRQDLDLVIHLGDYIYEYEPVTGYPSPTGNVRPHEPASETDSLAEYRVRHAQYRTDEDLQAAHQAFPWVVTWDDHEVENNYADEISENDDPPERFLRRRAAAYRAYYEHMPLSMRSVPRGPDLRLYRRFTYGRLARFNVLDTRQYRDDQANDDGIDPPDRETRDPRRTLTGDTQERWLLDGLAGSRSTWNVLAQQLFFSEQDLNPAPGAALYNMDAWDGYEGQRNRLVEFLDRRKVSNPIVLTGDVHNNWANDIKRNFDNPGSRTVGTEYVGTSITSNGNGSGATSTEVPDNPHIKFFNDDRGYVLCSLTPQQWTTEYRVVKVVNTPAPQPAVTLATFVTENGNPGAQLDGGITAQTTAAPDIQSIERSRIQAQQKSGGVAQRRRSRDFARAFPATGPAGTKRRTKAIAKNEERRRPTDSSTVEVVAVVRVLFVCMGNICRSPIALGVFEAAVRREGLEAEYEIPDPYSGGASGFDLVMDLAEIASEDLLKEIREQYLGG